MRKIIVYVVVIVLLVVVMFGIRTTAFAVSENDIDIYDNNEYDYRTYWLENKENIAEIFNPYTDGFRNYGCIDYIGLRNSLDSDSNQIKALAQSLTDKENSIDNVYNLHKFVYEMEYADIDENLNAEQVLKLGKGDCSEKSVLFFSLLEAKDIDAYIANGKNHRYLYVNIDDTWLPIDTTTHDIFFVYKSRDNEEMRGKYNSVQPFLVNRTSTLFNKNWCN